MSEKTITLTAILWESDAGDLKHDLTERARVIDIDLTAVLGAGEWVIGDILTRRDGRACILLELAEPDEKRWAGELGAGAGLAPMNDTTPETIAQWMLDQLEQRPELYQIDAVDGIIKNFGTEFTTTNRNGSTVIHPKVTKAFNKLTAETVVWDHWSRYWRKRQPGDAPGREQR